MCMAIIAPTKKFAFSAMPLSLAGDIFKAGSNIVHFVSGEI